MKRFFAVVMLCAVAIIGTTSCKKQAGEGLPDATEKGKVRIEKFEGIERGKGFSGDLLLSVSNGLRSNITLSRGVIVLNLGEKTICTISLTGEVVVPKRVISSVRVPVSLDFSSPMVAYGVIGKFVRGELGKMTATIDADVKVGVVRKHIYKENISLSEALQMMGVPADGLKSLVKKNR